MFGLKLLRNKTLQSFKVAVFLFGCAFWGAGCLLLTSCGTRNNKSALSSSIETILKDCEQAINPSNTKIEFTVFKNGDLIFVADTSSFSSAVAESTGGVFSHVGIIQRVADTLYVLEAMPRKGVVRTPIESFIAEAPEDGNGRAAIRVKRLYKIHSLYSGEPLPADSIQYIVNQAVERAVSFLGTPYDSLFYQGSEALYCSELVYESFLQGDEYIFPVIAMSFKDSTGAISPYWIEHYKKLDKPVPQDCPGSNPNDLYKSELLKEIAF